MIYYPPSAAEPSAEQPDPCRAGIAAIPGVLESQRSRDPLRDPSRDVPVTECSQGWPAMPRDDRDRDVAFVSPPGFVSPMAPLMKPHVAKQPRTHPKPGLLIRLNGSFLLHPWR